MSMRTSVCHIANPHARERIGLARMDAYRNVAAVRRLWVFIKFWLLPLLRMSLIFIGSADSGSVNRSSRIIGPLVQWLFPSMSEAGVGTCVLIVRKCAHVTEYALFAI